MSKEDIGEKVIRVYEDGKWAEYGGEGWDWKRIVTTIVLAAAIVGGATYKAMSSYTPNTRIEHRIEQKEAQTSYTPQKSYVATSK